jgi:hypothetical protein
MKVASASSLTWTEEDDDVPTRRWLAAGFVLTLIAPALAQEAKPVKLEWKFEKDKPFYQTLATETSRTLKVSGIEVNQKQKETFILGWTPVKQEDKNWVLKLKIEGVHVDGDFSGSKVVFDSTRDDNPPGALSDCYKALVGAEFTLTVSPEMKVTKIEGGATALKDFIKKLAAADPQTETLLNQILTEDNLKAMADAAFAAVPDKEVKKGDKWDRTAAMALGPIGTYETKYTYAADGPSDKDANVEKISVKAEMTYKAPADRPLGPQPFKINSADLKSPEPGTGVVEFRKDKGRVEKSELKVTLKGKMNIDLNGSADVDVTQTQTTTVTTSDDNPIPKKK